MPKVTGVGGIFFKAKGDPQALAAWYKKHLGIDVQSWGGAVLRWSDDPGKDTAATAWTIDDKDSEKYSPSESNFMINYRVDDLLGLVANLKMAGVEILQEPEPSEYGKFASIMDPEGNKVELWEP